MIFLPPSISLQRHSDELCSRTSLSRAGLRYTVSTHLPYSSSRWPSWVSSRREAKTERDTPLALSTFLASAGIGSWPRITYVQTSQRSFVALRCTHQFAYNSAKAAVAHLTKMMATEFILKKVPVRVNGVAPGVYSSAMTADRLAKGDVNGVALGLQPVPAQRAGRSVTTHWFYPHN